MRAAWSGAALIAVSVAAATLLARQAPASACLPWLRAPRRHALRHMRAVESRAALVCVAAATLLARHASAPASLPRRRSRLLAPHLMLLQGIRRGTRGALVAAATRRFLVAEASAELVRSPARLALAPHRILLQGIRWGARGALQAAATRRFLVAEASAELVRSSARLRESERREHDRRGQKPQERHGAELSSRGPPCVARTSLAAGAESTRLDLNQRVMEH